MNQNTADFCRIVRARTAENQNAFNILLSSGSLGVAVGMLRQELDSLIRVAYLCDMNSSSPTAQALIEDAVNGEQWTATTNRGREPRITDREMVNIASQIGGWVNIIYSFGCGLLHLSNLHDHESNDPFDAAIDPIDAARIIYYLDQYHGYPDQDIDKQRLGQYLPKVMEKLVQNVNHYIGEIENANAALGREPERPKLRVLKSESFGGRPVTAVAHMQIRVATVEDAQCVSDFVTRIAQEQIAPTLSAEGLKHLIAGMSVANQVQRFREGYRFFIAFDHDEILGIVCVRLPFHLYYLFVRPDQQRKGIGRQLWSHARDSVCEINQNPTITVNSSLNAVAAYERLGFCIDGPIQESHGVRFQPMRVEYATEPRR